MQSWGGLLELLGHIEPRMAGRLALDPGGDLPTLLRIEARRLEMDCGQHRAGTAAPPRFSLRHCEQPATETAASQILRQKKPIDPQQPK